MTRIDEALQRAEELFRFGREYDAIDFLEGHLEQSPDDLRAARVLGRLYVRSGQPDRGAYWLRRALGVPDPTKERSSSHACALGDEPTDADVAFFEEKTDSEADVVWDYDDCPEDLNAPIAPQRHRSAPSGDPASVAPCPPGDPPKATYTGATLELPLQVAGDTAPKSSEDTSTVAGVTDDFAQDDFYEAEEDGLFIDDEEPPEIPWEDFALLEDDVAESEGELDDSGNVDALTLEEKATQEAARIATQAGWRRGQLGALVEVLVYHRCHYKTVGAVTALLVEQQVTPDELSLLHELRNAWAGGGYNRVYRGGSAEDGWPGVSWQIALELRRTLRCETVGEVFLFVDDCFDDWSSSPRLITSWPDFKRYLTHVLNHMEALGGFWEGRVPAFIPYELFPEEECVEVPGGPGWKELERYEMLAHQGPMERWLDG